MYSVGKGFSFFIFVSWDLVLFGLLCEGIGYRRPNNCAYLDCPAYEVIHTEKQFEIRSYKDANWISFPVAKSKSFEDASKEGVNRLFDYINGSNKVAINMSITAPIIVDIGSTTTNSPYIVYFYLPQKYQADPPLPLSHLDQPIKLPRHNVSAIRRFEGSLTRKSIAYNAKTLKNNLRGTPWKSATAVEDYSIAGYNAPYERVNIVNEIIISFDG